MGFQTAYFFSEEIALTSQDFGHHITEPTVKDVRTNVLQGPKQIPTENCWRKFGCACFKLKVGLVFKKPLDGFCWHNSCCQKHTSSSSLSFRNTQI